MHHWIETPDALAAHLQDPPAIVGLDTEFVRERTYWPKLALVQVALRDAAGDTTVLLVDPLADGMPEALSPLLSNPDVTKVMHSASEDLIALRHTCGVIPDPLFDTQVAAALAGIGAGLGYQKLVEQLEGVSLAKGETRSDWLRRPLSDSQLQYAADDVLHLHALHATLEEKLGALDRRDWLAQDCERMVANARDDVPEPWPHLSLRSAQFLEPDGQLRLLRLLRWREVQARESDRPKSWIMDNELAVTLAREAPASTDVLRDLLGAHPKAPRKLTDAIWAALTTPLADETDAPPVRNGDPDRNALRKLQGAVAELSREHGLPDGVLASRRWLERLLQGEWPDALGGWRRTLLEPRLGAMLGSGRAANGSV